MIPLIGAITALVAAVGTAIAQILHARNPNAHGREDDPPCPPKT